MAVSRRHFAVISLTSGRDFDVIVAVSPIFDHHLAGFRRGFADFSWRRHFSLVLYHRIAGIFDNSFAVIVAAASPISGQNLAAVVAVISPVLAAVSLSIDL